MEAGDSAARQSGIPTATTTREHFDPARPYNNRSSRGGTAMATATLINPSSQYHSHSFSHNGYHPSSSASIPGMISPVDSRRTSDESENPHRQSLPSISEVISGTKPTSYPPHAPTSLPPTQSLPSPFAPSGPPRSYDVDKHPSPRALHPSSGFPRPDPLPAFSDPARPQLSSRPPPPPPLNTFPTHHQHPSPPVKLEQMEVDQRHAEASPLSAGYPHHPPGHPAGPHYAQTGRLPPGQLPLSAYPVSPRHSGPGLPSPYDSQHRPPMYPEEQEYGHGHARSSEYKAASERSLPDWSSYGEMMYMNKQIAHAGRTVYHFAEGYGAAAREQQGQPLPSRLPTESEISVVIDSAVVAVENLKNLRHLIAQINSERSRENGGRKSGAEDDDVSMYGDGIGKHSSFNEVKKRRGRAAPPGRCHSCNRIDTPEWRRGPDGARTLCNACGLHYAKLERKRQLEQRSIRPKPTDDRN
ncbi:hypothetical protein NEUTE2DRAFT_104387 [Neurospora tetrasperma FGSC 2509]|nr:hypothetical protein NEUTE2DRAFT_104387 [Neurospora tetrasperma FGSC 2509]